MGYPLDVEKRIEELRRKVEEANYNYYILDKPLISDSDYDALISELAELERQHPELASAESPTRVIGPAPAPEFKWVTHLEPLLGLSNAYNTDELAAWDRRVKGLLGVDGGNQKVFRESSEQRSAGETAKCRRKLFFEVKHCSTNTYKIGTSAAGYRLIMYSADGACWCLRMT